MTTVITLSHRLNPAQRRQLQARLNSSGMSKAMRTCRQPQTGEVPTLVIKWKRGRPVMFREMVVRGILCGCGFAR